MLLLCATFIAAVGESRPASTNSAPSSRVVIVQEPAATQAFTFRPEVVRQMVRRGMTQLTGRANAAKAWQTLVTAKDIVGIKVFSAPGADAGTRPAGVEAVIEELIEAGLPAKNIIIWDKQRADLRQAGFGEVAARHRARIEGSANVGYDEKNYSNGCKSN